MAVFGDNRGDPILVESEMLALDGRVSGVPIGEEILRLRILEELDDVDNLSDVNRWGSRNLIRRILRFLYAVGCSVCGIAWDDRGTNEKKDVLANFRN